MKNTKVDKLPFRFPIEPMKDYRYFQFEKEFERWKPQLDRKLEELSNKSSSAVGIPELDADPAIPIPESAWVLHTPSTLGGGTPLGLLLALTKGGFGTPETYQFSYRTLEGTTKRVALA